MSLTRRLDYRRLILCAPLRSIKNPDSLARSLPVGLSTSRPCGTFPRPRMLTPTRSTAGLASRTETPLQSAPSESYLVGAFTPRQIGRPSCFWAVAWELGPTSPQVVVPTFPFLPWRLYSRRHTRTSGEPNSVGERTSLKLPLFLFRFPFVCLCRRPSELPIPSQVKGRKAICKSLTRD